MKTSQILTIVALVLVLGLVGFAWLEKNNQNEVVNTPPQETASIVGCYAVTFNKDVYTLNIQSQAGENFSGTLAFKNFEKDSSSGTYAGTYKDGILLGDYAFQSEGMNSLMQVIFKKSGDDFIRGYGELTREGTRFTDTSKVTYDASSPLSVFKKTECSL